MCECVSVHLSIMSTTWGNLRVEKKIMAATICMNDGEKERRERE